MTIAEDRAALATLFSGIDGITCYAYPSITTPSPGDAWVSLGTITPVSYRGLAVVFSVVVVLSTDPVTAEKQGEQWAGDLFEAAGGIVCGDQRVEFDAITVQSAGTVPVLVFSLTLEA